MKQTFISTDKIRLDKILANELDISRNQIEKLIKEGLVFVNGKPIIKSSFKVSVGDEISYSFKEALKQEPKEIDFDIDIVYEDDYLMVINKPANLVVHPAPSVRDATVVDWLIARGISLSTISGENRYGIVHRIDKDTTGALVIAKDNKTHELLSKQLQDKSMGRYYIAIIDTPLKEDTIINKPIARNQNDRLKMTVVHNGRDAKSAFVKLSTNQYKTEIICAKLFTGRTHQIRVHLKSISRHILGDTAYGYKSKRYKPKRIQLHAYLLYLIHPHTNEKIEFVAPMFSDMSVFIKNNFDNEYMEDLLNPNNITKLFQNL